MKMASVADTALNHHSLTHSSAHDMELSCKELIVTGSQLVPKISCRSFWYMFERVGLRVHPCLTPVVDRNGSVMPHIPPVVLME